jgi:hypothetical protein
MVMKAKGKRQIEKSIIDEIMEEDEEEDWKGYKIISFKNKRTD